MSKIYSLICLFLGSLSMGLSQSDSIQLANPSFEDKSHAGEYNSSIKGWQDCGVIYFKGETPPDIHSSHTNNSSGDVYFGVRQPASDGLTFLGFVVRNNETYESVSQRLVKPIEGGKCYSFSIDLSRSLTYISPYPYQANSQSYTRPVVLRIYGGSTYCGKRELLAESEPVANSDWETYSFEFRPNQTHRYISISAFYKVPVLIPYNGNLLLDNASAIVRIPCPNEEIVAEEEPVKKEPEIAEKPKVEKPIKKDPVVVAEEPIEKPVEIVEDTKPKPKKAVINQELDRNTIKKGQTINLKNIYFDADSIVINPKSFPALEELADFLKVNKDITIEVGGHTNGIPPPEFCDSLSTARAKSVATYLFNKGIPKDQVEYKGYGKRQNIASNDYAEGRRRNQRVEIKILNIGEDG